MNFCVYVALLALKAAAQEGGDFKDFDFDGGTQIH